MDVYMYQAALYCGVCGKRIRESIKKPNYAPPYDSDDYPTGPYADGGGESDCPQHCDSCGVFLENPLTPDGMDYVKGLHEERPTDVTEMWMDYYD